MQNASNLQDFLTAYTELEQLVRQYYQETLKDYETEIQDQNDADRLRICRLLRNYAAHHPDIEQYFPIAEETVQFLKNLAERIKKQHGVVKDFMRKVTPVKIIDSKEDAMHRLCMTVKNQQLNFVPVVDQKGCFAGMLTINLLANFMLSKDKTGSVKNLKLQKTASFAGINALIDDISEEGNIWVVTDSGTPDSRYRGILIL